MTEHQTIWQKVSGEAVSYRRMYALAVKVVGSDAATDEMRRAARKVTRTLSDVIELPIADAKILSKARKKFNKLVETLQDFAPENLGDTRGSFRPHDNDGLSGNRVNTDYKKRSVSD